MPETLEKLVSDVLALALQTGLVAPLKSRLEALKQQQAALMVQTDELRQMAEQQQKATAAQIDELHRLVRHMGWFTALAFVIAAAALTVALWLVWR